MLYVCATTSLYASEDQKQDLLKNNAHALTITKPDPAPPLTLAALYNLQAVQSPKNQHSLMQMVRSNESQDYIKFDSAESKPSAKAVKKNKCCNAACCCTITWCLPCAALYCLCTNGPWTN